MSTPSVPLTAALGGRLLRAAADPWHRTLGPVIAAFVLMAAVGIASDTAACTAAAPCGPDHVGASGFGLLLASALVVRVSGLVGVAAGVGAMTIGLATGGLNSTGSPAVVGTLVVYVAALVWAARRRGRLHRAPLTLLLAAGAPTLVPSALGVRRGRARLSRLPLAAAAALAVAAAALVWYGVGLGQRAAAEEAAAPAVVGTVAAHVDEFVIAVSAPGRPGTTEIDTLDAAQYPVGSRQPVWLLPDDDMRLLAEPYDGTALDVPAALAAALATALVARAARQRRERAAFDAQPQPVTTALARRSAVDGALLYPSASSSGTAALVDLPPPGPLPGPRLPGTPDAGDHEAPGPTEDEEHELDEELPPLEPVTVIGVPAPGHWVATRWSDGTVDGPVRAGRDESQLPAGTEDEMDELVLRGFSPGDLAPRDRSGPVMQGQHRVPVWAQLVRVALALLVTAVGDPLLDLVLGWTGLGARVAGAVAGLLALELTWRFAVRPRLSWDGAGIRAVGPFGPLLVVPWPALHGAIADGSEIRLLLAPDPAERLDPQEAHGLGDDEKDDFSGDDDGEFYDEFYDVIELSTASPRSGPLHTGWRTAAQLRAVLLSARRHATGGAVDAEAEIAAEPPPRRPWGVLALWALVVVVAYLYG
ncbi:hypothetical protein KZX45_00410 [Georgenia sp. EYE_87]|uniref:hypothetical protein n=1 Tax=Georgenia sp. EYE_87 TaxID=2853448 RepID=UPI002005E887|nr:hypothetical protein [Georgenia sp. EYE_87]MCK6209005.1 hypothetical protein [Georgenia sp. EYE_87]